MTEQKTILCIGDSIVEGYPYDPGDSWVSKAELLWKKKLQSREPGFDRDALWINAGISGQLTSEIRFRLGPALLRCQPDLVILSCGTNDFIFLDGPRGETDSAWANIQAMATAALQFGAEVIIAAPPMTIPELASRRWSDGTDYDTVNRKLRELRQRIRTWCGEQEADLESGLRKNTVRMWDVLGEFEQWVESDGGTLEAAARWFVDGLHPTKAGYANMAEQLCELMDD